MVRWCAGKLKNICFVIFNISIEFVHTNAYRYNVSKYQCAWWMWWEVYLFTVSIFWFHVWVLWQFPSVKWFLKTSGVGLITFGWEKAVGLFFTASAIIQLELNYISFDFINSVVTRWAAMTKAKYFFFPVFDLFALLRYNFVLDILRYDVQKPRMSHPLWYYHENFRYRIFEFANLHSKIFVFKHTVHFEFVTFFGHGRYPYLNTVSIHYA